MFALYENPKIGDLLDSKEGQNFDRKGSRINETHLTDLIIGFANADGGVIVLGIESDKTITGIEDAEIQAAKIRKKTLVIVSPPIPIQIKIFPCLNHKGDATYLVLIEVRGSGEIHTNSKDEVFLRVGDENMKLNHEQRMLLLDDKGKANFERMDAKGVSMENLDSEIIEEYKQVLRLPSISTEELLIGRDLAKRTEGILCINMAGVLLFGKNPERWIERARIRILRYEGSTEITGENFNVTKDISITGPLPRQIKKAQETLSGILREFTTLDKNGKFITEQEYPEFAWKEAIVNAVVHRSYSLRGADIQIKMFDDHLEIISPGRFPGLINEENIKDTHYSRNPRIARVAGELGFVKELGEGINRIINEMSTAKLPPPVITEKASAEVLVKLDNNINSRRLRKTFEDKDINLDREVFRSLPETDQKILLFIVEYGKITTKECGKLIGKSRRTSIRKLKELTIERILVKVGDKGTNVHYLLGEKFNNKQPHRTVSSYTTQNTKTVNQKSLFDDN